jgi:hypothetical protein
MAFVAIGVSVGFACNINATVPLTTGAAWLVPLRLRYGGYAVGTVPFNNADAFQKKSALVGLLNDSIPTPGATRSGLAARSTAVGPRELKDATVSSARSIVPM